MLNSISQFSAAVLNKFPVKAHTPRRLTHVTHPRTPACLFEIGDFSRSEHTLVAYAVAVRLPRPLARTTLSTCFASSASPRWIPFGVTFGQVPFEAKLLRRIPRNTGSVRFHPLERTRLRALRVAFGKVPSEAELLQCIRPTSPSDRDVGLLFLPPVHFVLV